MVSIRLHGSVISSSLQQPCALAYLWNLPSNWFIWVSPWSVPIKLSLWPIFFSQKSEWKFQPYHMNFLLRGNCWSNLVESYLDTSRFEIWRFIAWASPPMLFFWYCAFLLKSLKLDVMTSSHFYTVPYHMHHRISVISYEHFNLSQSVGIRTASVRRAACESSAWPAQRQDEQPKSQRSPSQHSRFRSSNAVDLAQWPLQSSKLRNLFNSIQKSCQTSNICRIFYKHRKMQTKFYLNAFW
jgi:hypothetical protein